MNKRLKNLKAERVRFSLSPTETTQLPPYLGSTLRGGLSWGMRKVVCTMPDTDCRGCVLAERCAYSLFFETPLPRASKKLRTVDRIPHPVVFEPPAERESPWSPGECLRFDGLVLGRALEEFPFLIAAAQKMCEAGLGKNRARFTLNKVITESDRLTFKPGDSKARPQALHGVAIGDLLPNSEPKKEIGLKLETPLRLVSEKRLVSPASFRHFARALLSRISAVALFHGGVDLDLDFRGLLERADLVKCTDDNLRIKNIKRWSNRQKRHLDLTGYVGTVAFSGEAIKELWPYIEIGELLHVGKATIFGLGSYQTIDPRGGEQDAQD